MTTHTNPDPKRPWKAYAAALPSFIAAFVAYWIADTDPFTLKEMGQAALLAAGASGIVGVSTFSVSNPRAPGGQIPPPV